jgi:Caspase domain
MANWAIIIGVDQYWRPEACLKGAVRDALKITTWLEDPNGGGVPRQNLYLLLSRSPASPAAPPGMKVWSATKNKIVEVANDLKKRSGGKGERLFFYFSGHGLTSRMSFSDENGLAAADFTDVLTDNSLTVQSISEYFEATQFQEQYFFIDGCRNIPWEETEFVLGRMPRPQRRDPNLPAIQQFICYATSPGVKAKEMGKAGEERGAFTTALLDGLKGTRTAKLWNEARQEYDVPWENLFKFVEDAVTKQRIGVGKGIDAEKLIQIPRQAGERGSANPSLGRFAANSFPGELLQVFLDPASAIPGAEINVRDHGDLDEIRSQISTLPVPFTLPPKTYSVRALAPNHRPKRKSWVVDLYQPQSTVVELEPGSPAPPVPSPSPTPGPSGPAGKPSNLEGGLLADLEVQGPDSLASLEVLDNSGQVLTIGQGSLKCTGLEPGFYRARLLTPEGKSEEQLIELSAGESKTVLLTAPKSPDTRLTSELAARAGFSTHLDNTIEVSETMGPLAATQLSTILTLAGSVSAYDKAERPSHRLRSLGVRSFTDVISTKASSGIQILFGIDLANAEDAEKYVSEVKLRVWPFGKPVPEKFERCDPFSATGLAEFSCATSPGPHWLAMELPGQKPLVLTLATLPGRLTMMVIQFNDDRTGRIFQYMPSLKPDGYSKPEDMRRLELMQRFYMSGRLDHVSPVAEELLYLKWEEPIAGCLGGYLMLRLGKPNELAIAGSNMTKFFGELSDSHVLWAEYQASIKMHAVAKAEYYAALDRGLPIFADGIARLSDAVHRYQIKHPRIALLDNMLATSASGLMWTAFSTKELPLGKLLPLDGS